MLLLLKIIAFLFAVFTLVVIHEYGHFLLARRFGVRVLRFSVGFGRPLFKWYGKDGTEYVLAAIPLGGYVRMLDCREMEVAKKDWPYAFDKKSLLQRLLIIFAGPVTNIMFAVIAFWLVFSLGITLPKPIVGDIKPDSIAQKAGLHAQDEIIAVNDKPTTNWQQVAFPILGKIGDFGVLPMTVMDNRTKEISTHNLILNRWKLDELNPDPLEDLGIIPYRPQILPIVEKVVKNSPAAKVNLQSGDLILKVDDQVTKDWGDFMAATQSKFNQQVRLTVKRGTEILHVTPTLDWKFGPNWKKIGYLGIKVKVGMWPEDMLRRHKYSVFTAVLPTLQQIWDFTYFNYMILGKLVLGKVSLHVLGGPITIFQSAGVALSEGIIAYVGFLAILSLMLALINLIPIPGLDGGYVLFMLIEFIRRKPISVRTQSLILRLGLIALILIMVQATVNDLMRILG